MSTPLHPDLSRVWRAARTPVLIGLVVLTGAVVLGITASQADRGRLDPRGADPPGSRALAELLRDRGVTVDRVTGTAQAAATGPNATLLVVFPNRFTAPQRAALAAAPADRVLIAPRGPVLNALAPGVRRAGDAEVSARAPACALPAAAAPADAGGSTYRVDGPAQRCYPAGDGAATVLSLRRDGQRTTVLGTGRALSNRALDEHANAALAMRLLGRHPRLVWYLPRPELPGRTQQSLVELVPDGWRWGAAQLAVGVVLLAAWRARRLGPVVAERLPVAIRAAETVEGRARLYRRAGARGHAADTLRTAARHRLAGRLGVSPAGEPDPLVDEVATRTGRAGSDVARLLYGESPSDDAALVRLADALDELEREVGP